MRRMEKAWVLKNPSYDHVANSHKKDGRSRVVRNISSRTRGVMLSKE
jgi:hypothetical protein